MPSSASPSYSSAYSKCVRTAALHLARLTAALHLSLHNSEVITPFRPFLQLKIFRPGRRNFTADFQEEKNCQNGIKVDCFFESCRYCGVPQKYVVSVYEYFLASILISRGNDHALHRFIFMCREGIRTENQHFSK